MGKQTAIALTSADERAFLTFLRSIATVKLIVSSAPTVESLWVDSFDCVQGWEKFWIWNTAFAWSPEYGTVTKDPSGAHNGYQFVSNFDKAPLLEYSRHNFQNLPGTYGRIYWDTYFSGIAYDALAFGRWYSAVVRWLRKNGKQARKGTLNTYYLPDAWVKYGQALQSAE
jgi:hypothetical protein